MLETKNRNYVSYITYQKQQGFTLVDTLVAMVLISIAIVLFGLLLPTLKISQTARQTITVRSVLEKKLEELRSVPFDDLVLQTNTSFSDAQMNTLNNSSASYSIEEIDIDGDLVADEDLKKIIINITWQNGQNFKTKSLTTLIGKNGIGEK